MAETAAALAAVSASASCVALAVAVSLFALLEYSESITSAV